MSNYFYIADSGKIWEFDPDTGTETLVFDTGPALLSHDPTWSMPLLHTLSDGNLAYISDNSTSSQVEFVIVNTNNWTFTTQTANYPFNRVFSQHVYGCFMDDGLYVWHDYNSGDVYAYDAVQGSLRWSATWAAWDTCFSAHEDALYVSSHAASGQSSGVSRLDPTDGSFIWSSGTNSERIHLVGTKEGIVYDRGQTLWALDKADGGTIWALGYADAGYTMRPMSAGGGRVLGGSGDSGAMLDIADGSLVYEIGPGPDQMEGDVQSLYCDDDLYAGIGLSNALSAYDPVVEQRIWTSSYPETPRWIASPATVAAGPTEADSTVEGVSIVQHVAASGAMDSAAKSDVSVDGGGYLQPVEAYGAIDTLLTADSTAQGVSSVQPVAASGKITAPHPEGGTDSPADVQLLVTGQFFGSTWDDGSLYRTDLASGLMEPLIDLSYGSLTDRYEILGHPRQMPDEPLYLEREGRVHMLHPASMQISAPVWQIPDGMRLIVLAGGDVVAYTPDTRIYRRYDITTGEMLWETGPIEEEVVSIEPDYFPKLDRLFLRVKESAFSHGNPEKNRYDEIDLSTGERSFLVDWPDNFFVRAADTFGLYGTFNINQPGGTPTEFYVAKVAYDGTFIWQTRRDDRTNLLSMAVSDDRVFAIIQDSSGGGISFHTVAAYADNTGTELWRGDYTGRSYSTGSFYRDGHLLSGHKLISPSTGDTLATLTGAGWEDTGLKERGFYMVRGEGFNAAPLDATPYVLDGLASDIKGQRIPAGVAALSAGADTTVANLSGQWSINRGEGTGESIVIAFTRSGGQWKVSRPVLRRPAT